MTDQELAEIEERWRGLAEHWEPLGKLIAEVKRQRVAIEKYADRCEQFRKKLAQESVRVERLREQVRYLENIINPTWRGHKVLTESEASQVEFPYPPEPGDEEKGALDSTACRYAPKRTGERWTPPFPPEPETDDR